MRTVLAAILLCFFVTLAHAETGRASYYHEPQRVACGGGRFNPNAMTAATRNHKCGTRLRVTSLRTGRSIIVTRTDHGPAAWTGNKIDLSRAAFQAIDSLSRGVIPVRIEVLQ